jgi:hypothetical protein
MARTTFGKTYAQEEKMTYLVAAYAVLWAISFGLVFSIVLRQRQLQQEIRILRQVVQDEPRPDLDGREGHRADGSFDEDRLQKRPA